jgi:hypothetical protein
MLLLVIGTLFSCKKDHSNPSQPNTNGKKYQVTFDLADFSRVILGSTGKLQTNAVVSAPASVRAMFDVIGYRLTSESGSSLLKEKTFNAKNYTAGTITDSLLAGTYKVTIYAGQTGLGPAIAYNTWALTYGSVTSDGVTYTFNPWKDTFYKTFLLTVTNSNLNQSVTLERIVGQMVINIKDVLPSDAYSFNMIFVNDSYGYGFDQSAPLFGPTPFTYTPAPVIIPDSSKNKPNFKFQYITENTTRPVTLTLFCKKKDGSIIAQRQFGPVTLQKNDTRVYSGNFFGTPTGNSGFQVTLDPVWSTDPINNQNF